MATRRTVGAQFPFSRVAEVLLLTIVVLVTHTAAKPQSEDTPFLDESMSEGSGNPVSGLKYEENRGREIFRRDTSTPFPDTTPRFPRRLRRDLRKLSNGYTLTLDYGAYKIHRSAKTWREARRICQAEGGDLAVINSLSESQVIAKLIHESYPHYDSANSDFVIVGYGYIAPTNQYKTVDGQSLDAAGFSGRAYGPGSYIFGLDRCGSVNKDGKLSDISCYVKYGFACELPVPANALPAGPVGPRGLPGIKGDAGIPGPAGTPGQRGEPGMVGAPGGPGPDGVPGAKGPQGLPGIKGDAGIPGPAGTKGVKGAPGQFGLNGLKGDVGQKGLQGNAGSRGLTGLKGNKGDLGTTGPSGPPGPVGPPGANGSNGRNEKVGPPGTAGSKGERGDPGMVGAPGGPGPEGPPGLKGSIGEIGFPGFPGLVGADGARGEEGTDGSPGIPGAKGSKGDVGEQGLTGPIGQSGERGPIGPIGPEGAKGEPGPGHDAACLAVLLSRLGRSRGLGQSDHGCRDSPFLDFDVSDQLCKEFIEEVYKQISGDSSQNSAAPDGQKKSPARTCKDLFHSYPDKPTGDYWIDPNGGDIDDAILVNCDADKRATCVIPKRSQSPPMLFTADKSEIWYNEIMKDHLKIRYTAPSNQINALQLLSSHAEQNVTYNCKKTVGYFDINNQTYERGLILLAWNDVELGPRGSQHLRYGVISDGCQDRPSELTETVISYQTDRPSRLPVLDVRLRDVGEPNKEFSVDIGDACFR